MLVNMSGGKKVENIINEIVEPVLLWTNPSITSFNPRVITFDESGFSGYLVEIIYHTAVNTRWIGFIPLGLPMGTDKGVYGYSGSTYVARLCGEATENSIRLGEGKSGSSVNNSFAIPTRIWGVKYTL